MIQQTFKGFTPTEEDLFQIAMNQPLDVKIKRAIDFLKTWEETALSLSENGYYLAFSGGKDSVVIKKLAEMAGIKFESYYNNVTIDPPELVRFIKKSHPDVKWNNPEKHLLNRMGEVVTPPTRLIRWCCREYKEKGGDGKGKIIGVRATESPRRKGLWREVIKNRRTGMFFCPILYWSDEDVWNFINNYNVEYCSLYDEGFKRLGCIGCPMGGRKNQLKEFARWPGYEKMWKKAFMKLFESRHLLTKRGKVRFYAKYESWENLWEWWLSGEKQIDHGVCQGQFMFTMLDEDGEE